MTDGDDAIVHFLRYSDRYDNAPELPLELDWNRFPLELRPEHRERLARKRKAKRDVGDRFKPKLVGPVV